MLPPLPWVIKKRLVSSIGVEKVLLKVVKVALKLVLHLLPFVVGVTSKKHRVNSHCTSKWATVVAGWRSAIQLLCYYNLIGYLIGGKILIEDLAGVSLSLTVPFIKVAPVIFEPGEAESWVKGCCNAVVARCRLYNNKLLVSVKLLIT